MTIADRGTGATRPPAKFWQLEILERLRPRHARRAFGSLLMIERYRTWINRRYERAWEATRGAHPLDGEDRRIVETLRSDGIAFTSVASLFGAEALAPMQAEFRRRLATYSRSSAKNVAKQYLQRLEEDVVLGDGDVLADAVLHPRVLRIAGHYLGMTPRFVSRDIWNTLEARSDKRVASQRWHRDYNDLQMLKIFIYLSDVGAHNGPFEYVRGSHYGGALGRLLYRQVNDRGLRRYPSERELEPHLGTIEAHRVSATGAPGTVIFVDTFGLHRGGYVEQGTRELVMALFASHANIHPPNFRADPSTRLFQDPFRRLVCGLDTPA